MSESAAVIVLEWDLVDRLNKSLRIAGCKPGEMRDILGVSESTMTNYLTGRTQPKDGFIRQWAIRCGVPFEWLRDGILTPNGGGDLPVQASRCIADLSDFRARRSSRPPVHAADVAAA